MLFSRTRRVGALNINDLVTGPGLVRLEEPDKTPGLSRGFSPAHEEMRYGSCEPLS